MGYIYTYIESVVLVVHERYRVVDVTMYKYYLVMTRRDHLAELAVYEREVVEHKVDAAVFAVVYVLDDYFVLVFLLVDFDFRGSVMVAAHQDDVAVEVREHG